MVTRLGDKKMLNNSIYFLLGVVFSAFIAILFYFLMRNQQLKYIEKEDKMVKILAKALEKLEDTKNE